MVDPGVVGPLTQFGAAGLIGWMWLTERRAAGTRERQAAELVERVRRDREAIEVLVGVVKENTRAMTALEAGQRGLRALVARIGKPCDGCAGAGEHEADGGAEGRGRPGV